MDGYKFCPNCGEKLTRGSLFCSNCGIRQEDVNERYDAYKETTPLQNFQQVSQGYEEEFRKSNEEEIITNNLSFPLSIKNKQKKNLIIWYFISLVGLFMMFSPEIFNIEDMDAMGALTFIGIFITLTGFLVGLLIFRPRAKVFKSIIEGENIIAVWKYSKDEYKQYVKDEYEENKSAVKGMMIFLSILSTIIFLPFIIFSEAGALMIIPLIGLLTLCGIAGLITTLASKKVFSDPYVIISMDGVLSNGKLTSWKGFGYYFTEAKYSEEDPKILIINYEVLFNRGANRHMCEAVLIPRSEERTAGDVIDKLNSQLK